MPALPLGTGIFLVCGNNEVRAFSIRALMFVASVTMAEALPTCGHRLVTSDIHIRQFRLMRTSRSSCASNGKFSNLEIRHGIEHYLFSVRIKQWTAVSRSFRLVECCK
jgi:hypothetical protein